MGVGELTSQEAQLLLARVDEQCEHRTKPPSELKNKKIPSYVFKKEWENLKCIFIDINYNSKTGVFNIKDMKTLIDNDKIRQQIT